MKDKVPQEVIEERFDRLYEVQKEIAEKLNNEFLNTTIDVLVEGKHDETDLLLKGRHVGQAPDIDGNVIINSTNDFPLSVGDIVKVKITEIFEHDLIGEIVAPDERKVQ